MKLYYSPGACSLAGRIALHEAGLAAEFERVDLKTRITERGYDYLSINPKGYVPLLALDDGNAITEKKVADVILQARDRNLFNAVTDCGAGGLSSAVGEMGEKVGAYVELDRVPLKYAGLRYDEIWISEAQERMVLAVPQAKVKELLELSKSEDVEATVIGQFGTDNRDLILNYRGTEVGRISMHFMHDGIPMHTRKAIVPTRAASPASIGRLSRGRSKPVDFHTAAYQCGAHMPSLARGPAGHASMRSVNGTPSFAHSARRCVPGERRNSSASMTGGGAPSCSAISSNKRCSCGMPMSSGVAWSRVRRYDATTSSGSRIRNTFVSAWIQSCAICGSR